jgi:WD40 repeat protein
VDRTQQCPIEGDHLAAVRAGGRWTVFDSETFEPKWTDSSQGQEFAWPSLSSGGEWLSGVRMVRRGRQVEVFEAATGRAVVRVRAERLLGGGAIRSLVSPDRSRLLVVGDPQRPVLFDLSGPKPVRTGELPVQAPSEHQVTRMVFSRDGSRLALTTRHVGGGQGPITVWETSSLRLLGTYPGRRLPAAAVGFSPDARSLLIDGGSGVLWWRFQRDAAAPADKLAGHMDEAWAVAFSPRGDAIATGSDDTDDSQTIRVWDAATGRRRMGWNGGTGTVSSLAFAPGGDVIVSAHLDEASSSLRAWDTVTGRWLQTLDGPEGKVRSVAYDANGRWLAACGDDRLVWVWDGATRRLVHVLTGHEDKVRHVAFSPDGRRLASASNDRTVRLWELTTGGVQRVLLGSEQISAVAFAPDGKTLAAVDEAGTVTVWDAQTGAVRQRLQDEEGAMRCLAFAPDGQSLAAAGEAMVIRLWDTVTGQELLRLDGHAAKVNAGAFSPDGQTLATCSHDGTVRLWRSSGLDP